MMREEYARVMTVYAFELPKGHTDEAGNLHRKGKMRIATAGDEIAAAKDPRVLDNPAYLSVVLLSRVITEMEGIEKVDAGLVAEFCIADMAFLQEMYERINAEEPMSMRVICPHCGREHEVQIGFTGEFR